MLGVRYRLGRGMVSLLGAAVFVMSAMSARASVPQEGQAPPAMAADADPTYEVATVKPSRPDERWGVQVQGTRLSTTDTSLVDLMMFAYGVHPLQVTAGPEWIKAERFDLLVQPSLPGRPSTAQMKVIMQRLLADRFQLSFHHGQKELPVYRIVVAKGGPKIAGMTPTTAASAAATNTAAIWFGEEGMTVHNATMAEFASLMQRYVSLERPIVDHTGIKGKHDFKLSWTPDPSQFNGRSPWPHKDEADAPPGLYTAIQEQLGLKLEAAKEATDVLVIDHVEKPSQN